MVKKIISSKDRLLAKKWLEDTFMEKAEILDVDVKDTFRGEITEGKLLLNFKEKIIEIHIHSDSVRGYRSESYIIEGSSKRMIGGHELRMISENKY